MIDNSVYPVSAEPVNQTASLTDNIIVGDINSSSDFRKQLFTLVNLVSSKKYYITTADFINPTRAPDRSVRNTNVLLIEQPNLGLFNPKVVSYNRIHTSRLGSLTLPKGNAFKVSDLLPQINGTLNTSITPSELNDNLLPPFDINGNVTFSLSFNDNSFRYYSGEEVLISAIRNGLPITKESIGLSNVDNTSDINKPLSNAQIQALQSYNTNIENYIRQYGVSQPLWNMAEW